MGSRTNQVIDNAIDRKLKKSFILKSPKDQLLNYCAVKKYGNNNSANLISDLIGLETFIAHKDSYNNEVCNFLNYSLAKTQSKFNILRMFKPGEILNTVIGTY